jgi:hypothetical protein
MRRVLPVTATLHPTPGGRTRKYSSVMVLPRAFRTVESLEKLVELDPHMLKRYTVVATGREGVPLRLLSTMWLTRAIRAFNDAKNSGEWVKVEMQRADRVMMAYRVNPERRNRDPAPGASAPR